MERRIINPWNWQAEQGWSWAIETNSAQRTLYCAGQVSMDGDGKLLHVGDMRGQINQALDNLETVLSQANYQLADVVRIDYYTTDADCLMANWDAIKERLVAAGCRAGGVLLGVSRLAFPELLIEIEAIAVQ
jgi:enamine deaminase RidA (YjgF/YER057c/UK114 family)